MRVKVPDIRTFKIEFWYQDEGMKELFAQLLPLLSKKKYSYDWVSILVDRSILLRFLHIPACR